MITPQETQALLQEKQAVLVDVREENELAESGTITGALWMPTSLMDDDEPKWKEFKAQLPKDRPVVFYCRSGQRSGRVTEFMKDAGFDAVNGGGFAGLKAGGLSVSPFRS